MGPPLKRVNKISKKCKEKGLERRKGYKHTDGGGLRIWGEEKVPKKAAQLI